MKARLLGWLAGTVYITVVCAASAAPPTGQALEFFEKRIRPVLVQSCYSCHSAKARRLKGGLRLDSRAALLKGGDSGPAIIPGQPAHSKLVEAIGYMNADLHMPPRGKLSATAVADLTTWVRMGAPWPSEHSTVTSSATPPTFDLGERKRTHWAWQPLRSYEPPAVRNKHWSSEPLDCFILARLEAADLKPAPPADRRTWLRRVSFDLIGLPPTATEIEAFLLDTRPNAYAHVVDRLLASPHFGERWGRHWLDLVRYAESRGHEYDYPAPNAYQYRDYVIRGFNSDLPYDRFVTEQIAGDLLPDPRLHPTDGYNESILGTGFWLLGEELHSPVDVRQDQADRFDNQIDVFSTTFLGLTVACARCHDHKFDAISSRDYYALYGILESSRYRLARFDTMEHNRQVARELEHFDQQARPILQRAFAEALRPGLGRMAEILLAAQAAMTNGCAGNPGDERLQRSARLHHLDPVLLARWVVYLRAASQNPSDLFYPWAKNADPRADHRRQVRSRLRLPSRSRMQVDEQVVIDYGKSTAADWIADGYVFGSGPAQPGDVALGKNPQHPLARVFSRSAAETDPDWNALRLAPGTELDPGVLGTIPRPGRTLCTQSFVIGPGKVYYLVRGTGFAYAAVDGHSLIAGPLHDQLIRKFQSGPTFQWVEHDLSPYAGQRTHIEFAPAGGADFAIAKVIQASRSPVIERPQNVAMRQLLIEGPTLTTLAAGYQRLFEQAAERLAAGRIRGADATDLAQLADWLVQHSDLLPTDARVSHRLEKIATPILAARTKLLARIKRESRLALALTDVSAVDEHVFVRGSPKALGPAVPRRFLEALAGPAAFKSPHGSGRLELARQVTDPHCNPLVARVMVNRIWHHLFGRGIVASVDNLGVLGDRPTHPELLDYLAEQFVRDGWSVKRLIRRLVLSETYGMSSRADPDADRRDPQDRLLHRMRIRRLEGEAIRDAMLTISGRLDARLFGAPVPIHLTEFQEGRGRPGNGPLDGDGRRSVYLSVRRNFLSSFLLAFDTPTPFSTVGRRTLSNVPAQSLILMNDPFVHQQATLWAQRVLKQARSPAERITDMYLSAFGRPPTRVERDDCLRFLAGCKGTGISAWTELAHVLLNLKEFIYRR